MKTIKDDLPRCTYTQIKKICRKILNTRTIYVKRYYTLQVYNVFRHKNVNLQLMKDTANSEWRKHRDEISNAYLFREWTNNIFPGFKSFWQKYKPVKKWVEPVEIWTDGHNEANASSTTGAWIIKRGKTIIDQGAKLGPAGWSDTAEAWAILQAAHRLRELGITNKPVIWKMDSQFLARMLEKDFKPRIGHSQYMTIYNEAIAILTATKNEFTFQWIPREQNEECDLLSKSLNKKAVSNGI